LIEEKVYKIVSFLIIMKFAAITSLRKGSYVQIDGHPCVVKNIDISKTGKHGHAKARVEAVGVLDGQKRVIVKPGHENVEVPIVEKKRAQVLSMSGDEASVMDMESYETINVEISEELKGQVKDGQQVEYWKVGEKIIVKRIV